MFSSALMCLVCFRVSRSAQKVTYSPRKERALKIYTEDFTENNRTTENNKTESNKIENMSSSSGPVVQPDLD